MNNIEENRQESKVDVRGVKAWNLHSIREWVEDEIVKNGFTFNRKGSPYSPSLYIHVYGSFIGKRNTLFKGRVGIIKVSNHAGGGGKCDRHYCIPSSGDPFSKMRVPLPDEHLDSWLTTRCEKKGWTKVDGLRVENEHNQEGGIKRW